MRLTAYFVSLILIVSGTSALGQSNNEDRLSIVFSDVSVSEALIQLDDISNLDFAYDPDILPKSKRINVTFEDYSIREILDFLLDDSQTIYKIRDGQVIITRKKRSEEPIVKGYIEDEISKEKLAYATIYFSEIERGVTANEQGYYSIKVPQGLHTVQVSYVGRDESTVKLDVVDDMTRSFTLSKIQSLQEVVITPDAIQGGTALLRSYQTKAIQELALKSPAVSGESDVLNIIRNLPGIESSAGGVGGMFVRGGEDNQNLVLMDGVPIYYPSHLLGIYSIFNAESVRSVEVYKGAFPARYGGKLSSIVDIYTKDGRRDGWHADVSGSYQSLRWSIEGPLTKKINIMIGGRGSLESPYINDVIGQSFYRVDGDGLISDYKDRNFKLNAQIGKKGRLILSSYVGKDFVNVRKKGGAVVSRFDSDLSWSNHAFSAVFQRELGRKYFLKIGQTVNAFTNSYTELLEYEQYTSEFGEYLFLYTNSNNLDSESKISLDHYVNPNVTNRYGMHLTNHQFDVVTSSFAEAEFGAVSSEILSLNIFPNVNNLFSAISTAIYIEQERKFSSKLFANMGLRYSRLSSDPGMYQHLEPRLSFKYLPNEQLTYNFALSKMVQYVHQLSDANVSFPKDIWLPASETFLPSVSWQIGAGVNKALKNKGHLDIQAFYKDLKNLNYVRDIYNLTDNLRNPVDSLIGSGDGTSYGLEIATEMPLGNFHWVNALTLSKTTRQFDQINSGNPFPFQYDRRIVLKSSVTYKANKHITLGTRLYLGTATPEYLIASIGSERNSFNNLIPANIGGTERARAQYRLDLSATLNLGNKKLKHHIKANFYNAFNIKNPGFTYFNPRSTSAAREDVFSLPFIPSAQYNLSF